MQSYATRLDNGCRSLSQPYRPTRQSLSLSPIRNKRQLISKETSLSYPNSPIQNEKSLLSFEANSISPSNSQLQSPLQSPSQLQSIDLLRERQSLSYSPPRDRRGTGFIYSSDLRPYKNSILGSRSGMISRSRSGVASPLVSSGMYLDIKKLLLCIAILIVSKVIINP